MGTQNKFVVGYVLQDGDEPPRGTVVETTWGERHVCIGAPVFDMPSWKVVLEAPKPKIPPDRYVVLRVRGDGAVVLPDGTVFSDTGIWPSTIATYAHPLPSREDMRRVIRTYGDDDILMYIYGKAGGA